MGAETSLIAILSITNLFTLYWLFFRRIKASAQVRALQRAIATFEVEGQTILRIDRINPDNVYLRSPGR